MTVLEPLNLPGETLAFDKFHREVRLPLGISELINRHNIRVVKTRGGFGFGAETFDLLFTSIRELSA